MSVFNPHTFASSVLGQYLDLDAAFGAQCHDLWLAQLYALGGRPGEGHAPGNGDTVNVFYQFPEYRPRLTELFEKHNGVAGIQAGDILFWRRGVWYPGSHTAMATGSVVGELVPVITQNPGPVQHAKLITRDLVGYLRPRVLSGAPAPKPPTPISPEEDDMATKNTGTFHQEAKSKYWVYVILNTESGFFHKVTPSATNVKMKTEDLARYAAAYDLAGGGFFLTSESEAQQASYRCAEVRARK